jgi:hypothetical protein
MYRKIALCILAFAVIAAFGLLPVLSEETPVTQPVKHTYVGNDKCKMCHRGEAKGFIYENWSKTKHAQSMTVLDAEKGETKDPKCLKCHVTGFGDTTAYTLDNPREEFANVGCEACHGPGSDYKNLSVMKDREKAIAAGLIIPNEQTCRGCHNEESPTFKGFDYEKMLPLGTHGKIMAAADTTKPAEEPAKEETPK